MGDSPRLHRDAGALAQFCIKTDELCINNDEFCIKKDGFYQGAGTLEDDHGTTHFVVVDKDKNVVSWTTTIERHSTVFKRTFHTTNGDFVLTKLRFL